MKNFQIFNEFHLKIYMFFNRVEKKKYKKLQREVQKMAAMMNLDDDEDGDGEEKEAEDEDKEESEPEEESSDESEDESSSEGSDDESVDSEPEVIFHINHTEFKIMNLW